MMANSTMFETCPIDIHHQTTDSEILEELPSLFNTPGVEFESFSGFSVARNINQNLDSFDTRFSRLSPSKPNSGTSYPSASRCLWRKYGVETHDDQVGGGEKLGPHEMAVYGTNVDERILPGFEYHVRIPTRNRKDRFQFGGRALHLLRIGQGYGKRLTFEDKHANINTNFFWSDTLPNGYAFTIRAVQPGDEFVLCHHQNRRPFGHATVVATSQHQVEISSSITKDKDIVKKVIVAMHISVRYTCEPHGMMSLRADELVDVMGVAVVRKSAKESRAITRCIEEVEIPGHGECLLYNEDD
ncbi:uncharacterized protein LOC590064 [Strongylocentrotus purpuratus]|uniref:Uncharacterized protein n=1 Tax=Strongylocentrotus purpuratus TaxID=7668 RepID=A0A7M7THD2_STRPU|nr:uncharacterized protein LOC590064 [Strongylocentrotus purpuratus]